MSRPGKRMVALALLTLIGTLVYALTGAVAPVQAQASELQVIIDGDTQLYPSPVIMNGRVLIPASCLAGALGAQINWDSKHSMVTLTADGTIIKLSAGSQKAFVNGNPVELDARAMILQDRFFAPVRFVAEALGAQVSWDGHAQTVEIASKQAADVRRVYTDILPAHIAFTSSGHLWLLDARIAGDPPRQVTHKGTVSIIGWSPDGQWLAYLQSDDRDSGAFYASNNRLWVVRSDGTEAYQIDQDAVLTDQALAWSPADNTIAYFTKTTSTQFTGFTMKLAQIADGAAKINTLLPEGDGAFDFGWAPDGQSLAVSFPANWEQGMRIDRVTLNGERTNLLQLGDKITSYDNIIYSWGAQGFKWSPDGRYLAYYLRAMSSSLSADGVTIQLFDITTGKTLDLGGGLEYPEWLAWSPDSKQLAFINGAGREATTEKRLFIASMTDGKIADCGSAGQVDTQPVWTQTVPYRVAFCRGAENLNWEGQPNGFWGVMVPGQQIWMGDSNVRQPVTVATADTAGYAPNVSPDGKSLIYLRLDRMSVGSLVLAPLDGSAEIRLVSGLTGTPGYYGNYYPDWFSIFWVRREVNQPIS